MTATEHGASVRSEAAVSSRLARSWLWLLAPVLVHAGFSWIGFSPTDDGWQQAVARRLAEGQVPHRDFIYIRPVLTPLLQVPLVWWGGEHVIWWSRLWGWLTLGGTCWIWSGLVLHEARWPLRYAGYFTALLLCAHTFPVMAWSTLDGMALASLGVWLVARDTGRSRALGFFAVGLAALCRQNFALFAPLLLLASGASWRRAWAAGFWSALPSLAYMGAIAALGAWPDFWLQMRVTSGPLVDIAARRFLTNGWFAGGVLAGLAIGWWRHRETTHADPHRLARMAWIRGTLFAAAGVALALVLARRPVALDEVSFGLFGAVLGVSAVSWRAWARGGRLVHGAALALAWVVTISLGKNSPALMSGILLLLAWRALSRDVAARGAEAAMLAVLASVAVAFSAARKAFPYRDRPVEELRYDVGEVLVGGAGLRTNRVTYLALADLRRIRGELERAGRPHAVLTDGAAGWIRGAALNPLASDWPQETELGYSPPLFQRVVADLQRLGPEGRIVVQKILFSHLDQQTWAMPPTWSYYALQHWVQARCVQERETEFFAVYRAPAAPAPQKD